jgi:hypothetical protein
MGANPNMLLQMLSGGGGGGTPSPGGAAPGGAPPGGAMGPAGRQLQGSDPGYDLKLVMKAKQDMANMVPALAARAPAAARAIASLMKGFDTAIKELQQLQATMQAMGGPIGLSAIPRPQPPGGTGAPSPVMPNMQG